MTDLLKPSFVIAFLMLLGAALLCWLGYVNAGGVILETFFISNPAERHVYLDRRYEVAAAIADTIHRETNA